ncbi:glycoside hydrolase family 3 N-terminal domain-containing protein [Prosthecomicrobium sp. N25]|uniref:glycoside hydrolase family 3 N-terminal domain-containing protein n=1 Tax=Prosthecomicrobium sp. N25 TaxID=3129254 RepID=UPI0030773741
MTHSHGETGGPGRRPHGAAALPERFARHACLGILALVVTALAASAALAASPDPAVEARVEALLARMTLEEKLGQLTVETDEDRDFRVRVTAGRLGNLIAFKTATANRAAVALAAAAPTPVPLLRGLDVLQGYRTQFMVPLGQAATFDPDLNRRAAEAIAREAAAQGVNWTYAPMVDIGRDPRWGRVVEGAGEDPFLGAAMARARVSGYRAGGLVATAKHFAAYGAPRAGLDYAPADMSEATLRDVYLPPFRAAVEAGAGAVMPALSALNGVPASLDRRLLVDVLRGEWGFRGFVVSDWGAIDQLANHGMGRDAAAFATRAFLAGVDMDMASRTYVARLPAAVAEGRVAEAAIDEAVRRVLRVKLEAGLDTRPLPTPAEAETRMLLPETRALAVEVARRGIVLLKNDGDRLPLRDIGSLLVVGGIADSPGDHVGPHAAEWRAGEVHTIRRALEDRAAKAGLRFEYRAGCAPDCTDRAGFEAAVEAARRADVVVAVLGEPGEIAGEAASRADLGFPGLQQDLLDRLVATGKPVVLVIVAGRPLTVAKAFAAVPSAVMAWYPGSVGSLALAEILFGDTAPSGKLPMTWPRHVGQIPIAHDDLATGRPPTAGEKFTSKYVDIGWRPQFPFGHGLSTARLVYGPPSVEAARVAMDGTVVVSVPVRNEGPQAARAVVQAYVRDLEASRVRPGRQLKGFAAVELAAGEASTVTLRIAVGDLGFHDETGDYRVEPGRFRIFAGPDADAEASVDVEAVGEPVIRPTARRTAAGTP